MPNGGKITIRAVNTEVHSNSPILLSSGPYVKVSFTDYGQGIPEDMLTKIFDPYFTTKKKGTGLGLAAAISIVQKHGGTITADSVMGEGTTFSVYLPASDKEPRQQQPGDIRDLGGGKILVLDDEPEVRKLAERYLTDMGFEVTVAEDGDNALAEYRRAFAADDPFRAVIADLTIRGGLGGKDLVSRLSRIDPGVKAIVSSGYSTDPVMSHPTEYGFCGVLPKPYRFEDLQRVLASVLGGQPEHE
jgi:CheY-like chemotaxis protein